MDVASGLTRALIRAGIPVVGVSIGSIDDRATWRVTYGDGVTGEQMAIGDELIHTYDPSADTAGRDEELGALLNRGDIRVLLLLLAEVLNRPPAQLRARLIELAKAEGS